jgi:hypothetical protein
VLPNTCGRSAPSWARHLQVFWVRLLNVMSKQIYRAPVSPSFCGARLQRSRASFVLRSVVPRFVCIAMGVGLALSACFSAGESSVTGAPGTPNGPGDLNGDSGVAVAVEGGVGVPPAIPVVNSDPGGPSILSLTTSANAGALAVGQAVSVIAIVTEQSGLQNLVGGQITSLDGKTPYDAFVATTQGTYSVTLSWEKLTTGLRLERVGPAHPLDLLVSFYNQQGARTVRPIRIAFDCGVSRTASLIKSACLDCGPETEGSLCGGDACKSLQSSSDACGACGNQCPSGKVCTAGTCDLPKTNFKVRGRPKSATTCAQTCSAVGNSRCVTGTLGSGGALFGCAAMLNPAGVLGSYSYSVRKCQCDEWVPGVDGEHCEALCRRQIPAQTCKSAFFQGTLTPEGGLPIADHAIFDKCSAPYKAGDFTAMMNKGVASIRIDTAVVCECYGPIPEDGRVDREFP